MAKRKSPTSSEGEAPEGPKKGEDYLIPLSTHLVAEEFPSLMVRTISLEPCAR